MNPRMICVVLCLGFVGALHAQALRDPTQPPPGAMPTIGVVSQSDEPLADEGVAVVVRDGKPFLVSGTRLYGVGQKLGAYRIERITETEVWLRNASELRKQPRFAGITRKESKPMTECTLAVTSGKTAKSPKVAPCAGAQP
jgi:hypothetical protein